MPSLVIGNLSGGANLLSGYWPAFSGVSPAPYSKVRLRWHCSAGGLAYVALSGGVTIASGAAIGAAGAFSGGLDGMLMVPGDVYELPRLAFQTSGKPQIFVACDAAISGTTNARMYYEVF